MRFSLIDWLRVDRKYPTIDVESTEPGSPNYIQLLLEEKDRRINDLEKEVEFLRGEYYKLMSEPEKKIYDPESQPKPVASYIPFSQLKHRLENHYRGRAAKNKVNKV